MLKKPRHIINCQIMVSNMRFTHGFCSLGGNHPRCKAVVWSLTQRVAEAAEGEGESSQIAEVKSIQLALDIAERETFFFLHLKADSFWTCSRNGYKEDDILLCILKSTTEAF